MMEEIKAYLNDTLTPEEKAAFEHRMQQDPALRQAVEAEQQTAKQLAEAFFAHEMSKDSAQAYQQRLQTETYVKRAYEEEALLEKQADFLIHIHQYLTTKAHIRSIFEEIKDELRAGEATEGDEQGGKVLPLMPQQPVAERLREYASTTHSRRPAKIWMYLAAACIALLLLFALGWQQHRQYQPTMLASNYLQKTAQPNAGITLGTDVHQQGITEFDSGHYTQAIEYLSQVPPSSADYAQAQFLLAYSHLMTGNTGKAIELYEAILEKKDDPAHPFLQYADRSRWFLALAYLESGQEQLAIPLLQTIVQDPHAYMHQSAQALLNDLNSFWRKFSF